MASPALYDGASFEASASRKRPRRANAIYEKNVRLKEVIDLIATGFFSTDEPDLFRPLIASLVDHDTYMIFADFDAYADCQQRVSEAFLDRATWHKKAVIKVAQVGQFSSDRTIRECASEIWDAAPVKVELRAYEAP